MTIEAPVFSRGTDVDIVLLDPTLPARSTTFKVKGHESDSVQDYILVSIL